MRIERVLNLSRKQGDALPDGKSVDDLVVFTDPKEVVKGITLGACGHGCLKENRCDSSRDKRIRKIGQPVSLILCGDQTIVYFQSPNTGKTDSMLLQCVHSPGLK
jgi:hypothetical protein